MKTKAKIKNITVSRLFNLGNYEHVRYELSAEVNGASAQETLLELTAILHRLKPIKKPFNYEHMVETLNKPIETLSEMDKAQLSEYTEILKAHEYLHKLRLEGLKRMDALGGTGKFTNAKDSWNDDTEVF